MDALLPLVQQERFVNRNRTAHAKAHGDGYCHASLAQAAPGLQDTAIKRRALESAHDVSNQRLLPIVQHARELAANFRSTLPKVKLGTTKLRNSKSAWDPVMCF